MNKIKTYLSLGLIAATFYACDSGTTAISPGNLPEDANIYKQILTSQISNNTFQVSNTENLLLNSRKVTKIVLENKNTGEVKFTQADYKTKDGKYLLQFSLSEKLDTTSSLNNFTVKYIFSNNSFTFIDSSLPTYKYPYPSTELYTKWDNFTTSLNKDVQDFDLVNNKIYYHPYGPVGLFQYTRTTSTNLIFDYSSGNYISATEKFVFCDVRNNFIYRYNIAKKKTDISKLVIPNGSNNMISGVDTYNNKLYVSTDGGKIYIYDFDLNLQNSIDYNNTGMYYLTIDNNIAYSIKYKEKIITRFNLTTNSFLNSIPFPSHDTEAIKIRDDKFFFTDYTKKIIGYFDISDIDNL